MSHIKSFAVASPLMLCLSCALNFGTQSNKNDKSVGDTTAISLEVSPMTSPLSTLILVSQNGGARAVRYSRYQLVVTSVWEGQLATDLQTRLTQRVHETALADACNGQNFGGGGLSRGDQFQLLVESAGRTKRQCLGFIDDAPVSVHQLLDDLLRLPERLPRATVADAYLRSEILPPERLEAIRRAGQMHFVSVVDAPRDLQPTLGDSIRRPHEFVPLSHQQYEALRTLIAPANDFVLTIGDSGYQLTFFQAQPALPLERKKE
jgi:hypothetical protein